MTTDIRRGRTSDLPRIVEIYNHYVEQSAATFDTTPASVDTRGAWFEEFGTHRHQMFVLEEGGAVIGYAYSGRLRPRAAYDRSVETSIYLAPAVVGRGLGERLYRHLLDALAATDVHRCYGVITVPNPGSIALHARMGFVEVGRLGECGHKFDRWWDVVWMEKAMRA